MKNPIIFVVFTLFIIVNLPLAFQPAASDKTKGQSVVVINPDNMPVRINSASLEPIAEDISELTYHLQNGSGEEIARIDSRVFVVDARAQIVHSETSVNREGVKNKEQIESSMQISRQLKEGERAYLYIEGVLGKSGRWRVDSDLLKNTQVIGTRDLELTASFERHLDFTAHDKTEILSLVLADIARDKSKRDLVGEPLIVRTDDLDVNLSHLEKNLANSSFLFLSSSQIRDLAKANGNLKYLDVESLVAEGSSAIVRIALRDQPSQYPVMRVPVTHTFVFSCASHVGKWKIQSSSSLLSGGS